MKKIISVLNFQKDFGTSVFVNNYKFLFIPVHSVESV